MASKQAQCQVPYNKTAPKTAREFVIAALAGVVHDDIVERATLCTSECVSNSVNHSRPDNRDAGYIDVHIDVKPEAVRIDVLDAGRPDGQVPVMRTQGCTSNVPECAPDSGLGLFLVNTMASRWGTNSAADGDARTTVVWMVFDTIDEATRAATDVDKATPAATDVEPKTPNLTVPGDHDMVTLGIIR